MILYNVTGNVEIQLCTWEQKAAMCVFQNFREIAFENFENCHAIFTSHMHARKIISGPINHTSSIFWQYEVKTALNVIIIGIIILEVTQYGHSRIFDYSNEKESNL